MQCVRSHGSLPGQSAACCIQQVVPALLLGLVQDSPEALFLVSCQPCGSLPGRVSQSQTSSWAAPMLMPERHVPAGAAGNRGHVSSGSSSSYPPSSSHNVAPGVSCLHLSAASVSPCTCCGTQSALAQLGCLQRICCRARLSHKITPAVKPRAHSLHRTAACWPRQADSCETSKPCHCPWGNTECVGCKGTLHTRRPELGHSVNAHGVRCPCPTSKCGSNPYSILLWQPAGATTAY